MAPSNSNKPTDYPALPTLEVLGYCAVYCSTILWSISTLLTVSSENEVRYIENDNLGTGWYSWIGRHKDVADFEWTFWENYFFITVVIGFLCHFVIARIADRLCPTYRFDIYCIYSVIFTLCFLGIPGTLFLLFHFTVQYLVAVLTKSVLACWVSGCVLSLSLTNGSIGRFLISYYPEHEAKAYFILFTTAMCNLRYISFSIEYVWSLSTNTLGKSEIENRHRDVQNNSQIKFSFKDLLVYQMYYPLCYGGPVINYNDFSSQILKPPSVWSLHTTVNFILGVGKFLVWHIVLIIILHFFYIPTISGDYTIIARLPLFSLLGFGLGMVMLFCFKYICMYGLTSFFSSSDNLIVPGPPHCVFVKHRMVDMWKYFDKGLHLWLLRYIYIPLGGSKVSLKRLGLASMLPFAFVYMWHGSGEGHAYWAALSWLGVFIETLSYKLYKTDNVKSFEARYLSPACSRRIRAALSAPLLCLLLISNLFFLCPIDVTVLFCKRFFFESFQFVSFLLLGCYSGCQTCMELNRLGV